MRVQTAPMTLDEMRGLPELLDCETAARILGISVRGAARLAHEGKLPAVKIGRSWRFNRRRLLAMAGLDGKGEAA